MTSTMLLTSTTSSGCSMRPSHIHPPTDGRHKSILTLARVATLCGMILTSTLLGGFPFLAKAIVGFTRRYAQSEQQ